MIATVCGFPTDEEDEQMALQSWKNACVQKDLQIPFDYDIITLVRSCH